MKTKKILKSNATKILKGKVIHSVNIGAVNCAKIYFDDGTFLEIEAETVLPTLGLVGNILTYQGK